MKLIIGVYDRELSHHLAIILSSKKIVPIEAESMEEIPALLKLHPNSMLLCEETSVEFYNHLQLENIITDIFLLYHPNLDTTELFKLRQFGIRSLIPYTENPQTIIEVIIKQLSILAQHLKKDDKSILKPVNNTNTQVAIHLMNTKKWAYGNLVGLNSSKVSVTIDHPDFIQHILETQSTDSVLMYLQGLNIRAVADLVHKKDNHLVFRYRHMSKEDAQRLAYFINFCQKNPQLQTMTVNI